MLEATDFEHVYLSEGNLILSALIVAPFRLFSKQAVADGSLQTDGANARLLDGSPTPVQTVRHN